MPKVQSCELRHIFKLQVNFLLFCVISIILFYVENLWKMA